MARSMLPSLFGTDKSGVPPLHTLHHEIDRIFDEFKKPFSSFDRDSAPRKEGWLMPKIDVSETDKSIEVIAEIPGVKEADIDVTVTNNVLCIQGEKAEEREEKMKDFHLVERSRGSYFRSLPLGFDVNPDQVTAVFDAGVLTITVKKPKDVQSQTKKIAVTKAN